MQFVEYWGGWRAERVLTEDAVVAAARAGLVGSCAREMNEAMGCAWGRLEGCGERGPF